MAEAINKIYMSVIFGLVISSCLILMVISFQQNNTIPSENSMANLPAFNSLNSSIGSMTQNTHDFEADLNGTTQISFGWIIWNGVINFGKVVIDMPIAIYKMLYQGLVPLAGAGAGILATIFSLIFGAIMVNLIVLLVRFWRQGT